MLVAEDGHQDNDSIQNYQESSISKLVSQPLQIFILIQIEILFIRNCVKISF